MKHSIRLRVTLTAAGLMAAMVALMLVINYAFLRPYYFNDKKKAMIRGRELLEEAVEREDLSRSRMQETLDETVLSLYETANISSIVVARSGFGFTVACSNDEAELLNRLTRYAGMSMLGDSYEEGTRLLEHTDTWHLLQTPAGARRGSYMDCWGLLAGSDVLFLMTTPLESMTESAALSNRFLLTTGIVCVLLGALAAYFWARRLTRPILRLTEVSQSMAGLDFSNRYDRPGRDEIAELGRNMNTVSDTLEKTIRELRETNETLRRELKEKAELEEMRRDFLNNVSHELKTPIALIRGYAEGLSDCVNDDAESREFYCGVITDEAEKMNRMVKKLLTLDHLESGMEKPDPVEFDLTDMLRGVMESSKILGPDVTVSFREVDPLPVVADEFQMEEVFTNYLSNAYHHVNEKRWISVTLERLEKTVRVCVFNTGDPIPEEDLDRIWDKFYKVDKARTRAYGGTGIGLSIVKAVMESHGTAYGVRNKDDGVEFWFEVPLAEKR